MMGRPTLLTPELTNRICSYIKAGSFPHVAAQAHGIRRATFFEWMARGEGTDTDREQNELYADFADKVNEAKALARMAAEISVKKSSVEFWLRNGPGKSRENDPGWTDESNLTMDVHSEGRMVTIDRQPGESVLDYLRQLRTASNGADTPAIE